MSLFIHSQPVSVDGAINQDAVEKLFDKNSSGPWAVFFREVFQNSNDARLSPADSFGFNLEVSSIENEHLSELKELVDNLAQEVRDSLGFDRVLGAQDANMLIIADSNTTGLSGHVDPSKADGLSNFVNFFYKLGQDKTRVDGGGAFGFGRNVFFQASRCKTIFVFTRFVSPDGHLMSRFMGMSAGRHYQLEGKNYTGRHWWGKRNPEYVEGTATQSVLPVTGADADILARKFGLFEALPEETGTVVGILYPDHDDMGELVETLRACALVYAWPHLAPINDKGDPSARFVFKLDGLEFAPHDPQDIDSPVNLFYQSYIDQIFPDRSANTSTKTAQIDYVRGAPALYEKFSIPSREKKLGSLSWTRWPVDATPSIPDVFMGVGLPKNDSIAIIRDAKIVVRYLHVEPQENRTIARGVFVANSVFDRVFRESENLTHDDWSPTRLDLPRGSSNPVRQVLDAIPGFFRSEIAAPSGGTATANADVFLGDQIGNFIRGLSITGSKIPQLQAGSLGPSRKATSRAKVSVTTMGRRLKSKEGGRAYGQFSYQVSITTPTEFADDKVMIFRPKTSLGDELESTAPLGSMPPEVVLVSVNGNPTSDLELPLHKGLNNSVIEVLVAFETGTKIVCDYEIVDSSKEND